MILGTYNIIYFERFDFFHFWIRRLLYNGYNIKLTQKIIFGNIELVVV